MTGWIGRTLGDIKIELLLARSPRAEVYLARHLALKRAVAVKVFNPESTEGTAAAGILDRLERTRVLQHPHIVQIHDSGVIDGRPYVVMQYVPGLSLAAYLQARRTSGYRIRTETIEKLLSDISGALQYGYERALTHGSLEPANILLTSPTSPIVEGKALPPDVSPVLINFGLAGAPGVGSSKHSDATVPDSRSPGRGLESSGSLQADVYALGQILHALLAGSAASSAAAEEMPAGTDAPLVPGLASPLQSVLDRALDRVPDQRYASPREFIDAVRAAVAVGSESLTEQDESIAEAPMASSPSQAKRGSAWITTASIAAAIFALVGILGTRSLLGVPESSASSAASTPAPGALALAAAGDPIGVLRYQDGAALIDEVSFNASGMPLPARGSQYEVWLLDETGEEMRSVGYLHLDAKGNGSTSFVDPQGRNLLAQYGAAAITIEPDPDPSPNPSETVLQTVKLPEEGLLHVRHLLVSFGKAPAGIGLLDGLLNDSALITDLTKAMLEAYEAGDETATRSNAEKILNVLVGSQSPDHADWDGDGVIEDPSDGYGLMLNGDSSGYIQGSYNHAEFAANSDGATDNMQSHGSHVMISAQNLETWAPLLRDLAKRIVAAPFGPSMGSDIRQAVALANNMYAGTDLNGNERIEAITGEGGAMTGYQHALYMADMVVTLPK